MHHRALVAVLTLALTLTLAAQSQAATRYSSPGGSGAACTQASPCSVNTGLGQLVAGDTLYLRAGSYSKRISWQDITMPKGTSWANPVTVAGFPGETAIIRNTLDIGPNVPPNTLYLILRDFVVDMNGFVEHGKPCVWVGANRVRVMNLEVRNCPDNGVQVGGDFNEFLNLHMHHNPTSERGHGFYMWGSDNLIDNCDVHDFRGLGLHIFGGGLNNDVDRNIARNNRIYRNGNSTNSSGILLSHGTGNIAYNNLVYNNTTGAYGIIIDYGCTNCLVYNNTTVGNVNAGLAIGGGTHRGSVSTGSVFRNNIAYNNGSGAQVFVTAGTSGTFSNNLCSKAGPNCAVVGNPQFVNASATPPNYHLTTGSPARNAGTTVSMVSTDKDGVTRPQGSAYDIGAYEFVEGGGAAPPGSADAPAPPPPVLAFPVLLLPLP